MNSRTKIDSKWLSVLVEEFPQSADQIGMLAEHLLDKQERLARLIRFCAAHPELPMLRMYAEYGAALDAVALEPSREVEPEVTDEEAKNLPRHERTARTKRRRTRNAILEVAEELVLGCKPWSRGELTALAGIGTATLHNHFATNNHLVVAAYERILAKS